MLGRILYAPMFVVTEFPHDFFKTIWGTKRRVQFTLIISKNLYWDAQGVNTAKNTVILPDFLVWKFCRKAQFPQPIRPKLCGNCLSAKFPHEEIRWNYGIFRSVRVKKTQRSVIMDKLLLFLQRALNINITTNPLVLLITAIKNWQQSLIRF